MSATATSAGRGGSLASAVQALRGHVCAGSSAGGGTGLAQLEEGGLDPIGELVPGGLEWLVDHLSFLREPFNYLTGDPDAIKAHADGLTGVATQLDAIAAGRRSGLSSVGASWQGAAADAYQGCAATQAGAISGVAQTARALAARVQGAGEIIGEARSTGLSMVQDLLLGLIPRALAAAAGALETAGATVAMFLVDAVAEALTVASKLAELVQKVLDILKDIQSFVQGLVQLIDTVRGLLGQDRSGDGATSPAGTGGSGDGGSGGGGAGSGGDSAADGDHKPPINLSYHKGKLGVGVDGVGGIDIGPDGIHYKIGPEDRPIIEGDLGGHDDDTDGARPDESGPDRSPEHGGQHGAGHQGGSQHAPSYQRPDQPHRAPPARHPHPVPTHHPPSRPHLGTTRHR